jgi:RHS repeat-associated protein
MPKTSSPSRKTLRGASFRRMIRAEGPRRFRPLRLEELEGRKLLTLTLSIVANDSTMTEPLWNYSNPLDRPDKGTYTITRSGEDMSEPLMVPVWYSVTQIGGDGFSYDPLNETTGCLTTCAVIPANEDSVTLYVIPDQDGDYEQTESFVVGIDVGGVTPDEWVLSPSEATFTLYDSSPQLAIQANGSASESGPTANTFTITKSNYGEAGSGDLGFTYSVSGTATQGTDYTLTGTAVIPAGQTTATITVTPIDDCRYEPGGETVILNLPNQFGDHYKVTTSSASVTIADNDSPLGVSIGDWTGLEPQTGTSTASFSVALTCTPTNTVTVQYSTSNDTAVAGLDYTQVTNRTLTFSPGGSTSQSATVTILSDDLDEPEEYFFVDITASGAALVDSQGRGTIQDVDSPPSVSINDTTVDESVGLATLTVTLSAASGQSIAVPYTTTDGTAISQLTNANDFDYTSKSGTITFSPGTTTQTLTVKINDDTKGEDTEGFSVTLSSPTNATIGDGTAAVTITDKKPKPVPPSCENCSSGAAGDMIGGNGFGADTSFADPGWSAFPVRYSDGAVSVVSQDLTSNGFGMPWGITRSWTNAPGYSMPNIVGQGMLTTQQPVLMSIDDNTRAIVSNGHTARYFDRIGSSDDFESRYFMQEKLTQGEDEVVLTDNTGAQIHFYDFSNGISAVQRGQLKSYTDPHGNVISVVSHAVAGQIEEMQRSYMSGIYTYYESLFYTYVPSGDNTGLIATVTLRLGDGDNWFQIRKAEYAYYGSNEANGNAGNLKTVAIKDSDNNILDTTYYRYYKPGEANGYAGGLKYVFLPQSYARMTADLGTPLSASNGAVAPYADNYFEYDSQQRVTRQTVQGAGCSVCSGGQGNLYYDYTDRTGQVSYTPGPNSWAYKTIETLPDNNQNVVYTNGDGQVMLKVYVDAPGTLNERKWATFYEYDSDGRVAMRAEPSAVESYDDNYADLLHKVSGHYADLNDSEGLITTYSYYGSTTAGSLTPGGVVGYLERVSIKHGQTDDPIPQSDQEYISRTANGVTIYLLATSTVYVEEDGTDPLTTEYAYTFSDLAVESITTTDPAEGETVVFFDSYGRPVWRKDEAGVLFYTEYDTLSGAVVKTISDVNVYDTSDFTALPPGWDSPYDAAELITTYNIDWLGRPMMTTDANLHPTFTVYKDVSHEIRIYPGYTSDPYSPTTGPEIVIREDRANKYVEELAMKSTDDELGTEPISDLQSLRRTHYNNAGQVIYVDDYFALDALEYSMSASLGTINVNFYRTSFAYDSRGRQNRIERADGTIYRTVFDGQGRPVSEWVGISDTVTGPWSPTNAGDMLEVKAYEYDNGGIGDSHLTSITDALGRQTVLTYDFRGRLIETTLPDPDGEDEEYESPHYFTEYDNLGRVKREVDAMENETAYDYDVENRTTTTTYPDPGSGSPVTVQVFDARGMLISSTDPKERTTTYDYDRLGRLSKVTQPDPNPEDYNPAPATEYTYDGVGNLRFVTGPIYGQQTERTYDNANRLTEVLEPNGTTLYAYDDAGRLLSLTDPDLNVTTWQYDALGRVTSETNELEDTRSFQYDRAGRVTESVDRLGRMIQNDYNFFDQVTEERWYDDEESLLRTLHYHYDDAGQLVDADDPAASYGYTPDGLGRTQTETQSFSGFSPLITYDQKFNDDSTVTSLESIVGETADFKNTYVPDNLQRIVQVTQHGNGGNTAAEKRMDFAYNEAGQFEKISRYANVAGTEHVATSFYLYDPMGRLKQLSHSKSTSSYAWPNYLSFYQYTYDDASRLTAINSNLDGSIAYNYDNSNQLTQEGDNYYNYTGNGNRFAAENGPNNQLLSDGTYDYEYDAEGNRIRRTDVNTGENTIYDWDNRNRLTGVQVWTVDPEPREGWGESACDCATFEVDVPLAVEGQDIDAVITVTGMSMLRFEYWVEDASAENGVDYNSAATSWTSTGWVYYLTSFHIYIGTESDAENEATESFKIHVRVQSQPEFAIVLEADIQDGNGPTLLSSASYQYDVFNRLVGRTADDDGEGPNDPTDTFYSHHNGQIALQFDGAAASDLSHRYLWGPAVDQLLADEQVTSLGSAGTVLYPLGDHLNSNRDIATHNSSTHVTTIANHRNYDAFGNLISETHSDVDEVFGYTGRLYDEASKLQNNTNRWYDSKTGLWLSEDPIGFAGEDANLNRYVGNSPQMHLDPQGLAFIVFDINVNFKTLAISGAIMKEVRRILDDLIATVGATHPKSGKPCWNLIVNWHKVKDQGEYDSLKNVNNKIHFGLRKENIKGGTIAQFVTLGVEDNFKGNLGQGANYEGTLNPNLANDMEIATVIAHEIIWHGVGLAGVHYHGSGYTDAEYVDNMGKVFSPEAKKVLATNLGLTNCK